MDIITGSGSFDSRDLPDAYEPCFCALCCCRLGWTSADFVAREEFFGICDECACVIAMDNREDPLGWDEEEEERGSDDDNQKQGDEDDN